MTKLYIDIKAEDTDLDKLEGYDDCIRGLTDEREPFYIYDYDLIMVNLLHNKKLEGDEAFDYYKKHIVPQARKKKCVICIQTIDRFTTQPKD